MAQFDTVITNGTLVIPNQGQMAASVAIIGGKIAGLLDPEETVDADETIDAGGLFVFPGLIDPHMHIGFTGFR